MKTEILKKLIANHYLGISEAIWLNKTFDNQFFSDDKSDVKFLAEDLLKFLKSQKDEVESKSTEDNLFIFFIIQNLERYIQSEEDDHDEYGDDEDDEYDEYDVYDDDIDGFFDEIGGLNAKEQMELQKEAVAKYKKQDTIAIINLFHSFVVEKYPEILNGFDRSLYANAKTTYWRTEHIFNLWQIPTGIYEKIKDAEHKVEEILKEDAQKHSEKMFGVWYEDYKKWLKKNGLTKSTKLNIKDFFKSIKIKANETIIERVKEKYLNE